MKRSFVTALALGLALSQAAASTAFAAPVEARSAAFRTAQPQTFSNADLQRYGLDAKSAATIESLQKQGYEVKVMSAEEANKYSAGQFTTTTWLLIGAAVIVIIAVAAAD